MIRRSGPTLLDLIFPRRCLLCLGWSELNARQLCQSCAEQIHAESKEPACPLCGATVAPFEVSRGQCGKCRRRPPRLVGTVRVGPYGKALGALVRAFKYRGREELESMLGGWLAEAVAAASWVDRVEAVVSVPTHWKHRLRRPLYAAEALAAVVAERTHLPHLPILRRLRGGPHQIGLSHTKRAENVKGVFALGRGVTLRGAHLLLIDDVKTTGATLAECAKVLRKGGAAEVYGAVLATAGDAQPGSPPPASI